MRRNRYEPNSNMNITSLLDVAFMLLITFMIAAPVMNAQIDMTLPDSSTAQNTDEENIEVSVDKNGSVFIGQTQVEWSELVIKLKALKEDKNIDAVALRGSKDIDYGTIMQAVDAIKEAGITNLGLVALPKKKR